MEWLINVERLVEWECGGQTKVLWETPSQCHFVHHKSHVTWPRIEPEPEQQQQQLIHSNYLKHLWGYVIPWVLNQSALNNAQVEHNEHIYAQTKRIRHYFTIIYWHISKICTPNTSHINNPYIIETCLWAPRPCLLCRKLLTTKIYKWHNMPNSALWHWNLRINWHTIS
jgi:hypothetical protein